MCCFSLPVKEVASTQIFARRASKQSQILVYSMKISASDDLAMILPIPVPKKTPESGVKFLSLKDYPEFFSDLDRGFPEKQAEAMGAGSAPRSGKGMPPLDVVKVGNFEASFVPTIKDFDRLDKKFRLPKKVWDSLPQYQSYGFAVFKLKSKDKTFHPMAFEFPTTYASQLFFPTIHVHDGKVHEKAEFDHVLYCQLEQIHQRGYEQWEESTVPVGMLMDYKRALPVIERFTHVLRTKIVGTHKNQDILVG